MPSFQTLLPFEIYSFLDEMAQLYSQIEREMHLRLDKGEKIGQIEKSLQVKYQVDSTTVRNVYHNLKGKHQGIKELQKTQAQDLKNRLTSIKKSILQYEKRINKRIKKQQSVNKERLRIHQKIGMRVRVGVKLDGREPPHKSRLPSRSNDAPIILSDVSALKD